MKTILATLGILLALPAAALAQERERHARLLDTLVASVIPYEALLADQESRKWIAPSIWQAMKDFRSTVRALILPSDQDAQGPCVLSYGERTKPSMPADPDRREGEEPATSGNMCGCKPWATVPLAPCGTCGKLRPYDDPPRPSP